MSSNLISEKYPNDGKVNGFSAFSDKSQAPINGRYRSKSLSSDKLNKANADRAAILEDVEDYHISAKSETPGCLVGNNVMDDTTKVTVNGYKDGKVSYGSDGGARGRRVIFCVHGNPSTGCCAVIEAPSDGDPELRNTSISSEMHCHRNRNEEIDKRARRKLIIASVLCVIFMIAEIIGGYLSNSLAIATDAAHLLTDFASFMISLFALWVATRPATRRMHFGWYRAEVIGALTSVLLIWVVTGILVYMAVQRVIYRDFEIDATVMLITSAVGVLVNLIMGLTLHQHGHSHGGGGHGHSHGGSNPVLNNKKEGSPEADAESAGSGAHAHHAENINVRAAFIHVLGDFLQSFGVLVAAVVIYFKPEWDLVDPICTFLFSILVLITTFNIIKDALLVLMEGSPRGIDFQDVANTFLSLPGVVRVHNLRMWALSLDKTALAAHLAIRTGVSPQKVLEQATRLIHDKYNFFEMTLQIEEFSDAMEDCSQCQNDLGNIKYYSQDPNDQPRAGSSSGSTAYTRTVSVAWDPPPAKHYQPANKNNKSGTKNHQPDAKNNQPGANNNQPDANNNQPVAKNNPPDAKNQPDDKNNQPDAKNNQPDAMNNQPDAKNNQPDAMNNQPDAMNNQPDANNNPPDANNQPDAKKQLDDKNNQPDAKNNPPEAMNNQPDAKNNQPDAKNQPDDKNNQPGAKNNQPEAMNNQPDANNNQPDAKNNQPHAKNNQPDANNNQAGPARLNSESSKPNNNEKGNDSENDKNKHIDSTTNTQNNDADSNNTRVTDGDNDQVNKSNNGAGNNNSNPRSHNGDGNK